MRNLNLLPPVCLRTRKVQTNRHSLLKIIDKTKYEYTTEITINEQIELFIAIGGFRGHVWRGRAIFLTSIYNDIYYIS